MEFARTPGGEQQLAAGGYAAEVSSADLKEVVAFSRTAAGQKQLAASRAAAAALQDYLAQQRRASLEEAIEQYRAELKAVAGD